MIRSLLLLLAAAFVSAADRGSVPPKAVVPPVAAPAAKAPLPGTAGAKLGLAAQAIAGSPEAAKALPGLANLGAQIQGVQASAGADAQSDAARSEFLQKAGLGKDVATNAAPDPVAGPRYAARGIPFNGRDYPSVAFRPDRPVEKLIAQAVDDAQVSIEIALYEFKSRPILEALRRAKADGKRVRIVLDYSNMFPSGSRKRSAELQALVDEGFDLLVLRGAQKFGINHNKFMVFDGKMAQFGSYNYTYTSEKNHFENVKFTDDAEHVAAFQAYWQYMRDLAVPFDQAQNRVWPGGYPLPPAQAAPTVDVNGVKFPAYLFSPNPDGEDMLVRLIGAAKVSVDVAMFSYRSRKISDALLKAKQNGVRVRVIFDKSQAEGPNTGPFREWLAAVGIEVRTLAGPNPGGPVFAEKNHNKLVIVDGKAVETGSMNWSKNGAVMNFENMHLTTDKVDALAYVLYYGDMWLLAAPYAAPATVPVLPTDAELLEELLIKP